MAFSDVVDFGLLDKLALSRQLNQSRKRLTDLQAMCDWHAELSSKVRRAELLFHHVGIDVGCETLVEEVAAFNHVLAGLLAEEADR
jgi:hypothetical protein